VKRVAIAAGIAAAALAAVALTVAALRLPQSSDPAAHASAAASPVRLAPTAPAELPERGVALPVAKGVSKGAATQTADSRDSETRTENDLRALEDQALRQIDVMPLLRNAGIDPAALEARSDGNDILRHVAADELMTRSIMHDLLRNTVYPYGYPREQALADARATADRMVAAMIPEARADLLEEALGDGSSAEPEPTMYGADSGRTFAAQGGEGEAPSD
jgi:hypothetical protein